MNLSHETILLTGGFGFLGSEIARQLTAQGVQPVTFHRTQFDLTDREATRTLFYSHHPTIVIHCAAAVGGIQANQREPGRYFRDNLLMGVNVIDACLEFSVRKVTVVSTVCAYPKLCPVPFSPADFWSGYPEETNAGYGVAKKALLTMLEGYRTQYGLAFAYPVMANLYGSGDDFSDATSHVIPALIRRFSDAKERSLPSVTVWGDGSASREFLHVRDAARGVIHCTEACDGGPLNVGTGVETSILDLAGLIARLTGYGGTVCWDADKPNGQPRRRLKPSIPLECVELEAGLRETIAWWRAKNGG